MTRQNETKSYRKKGLSVFLVVLMILSVVAMSATFVGTVAAQDDPDEGDVAFGPSQIDAQQVEITFEDSAMDLFDPDTNLEDNFTVWNYAGEEIDVTGTTTSNNDYTVVLDLNDDLEGGAASVEFVEQGENVSIETASQFHDIGAGSDDITPFAGEQIAITNPADVLTITHPDGERERGTGANSTVYVLDTSEWSAGDDVNVTDGTEELNITLRGYDIDVETDQDEYTDDEEIEVTAEADRVERDMVINLYDEDGDRVAQQEETSGPAGVTEATFDASDLEGDYTAAVYDKETWISGESDEFSVDEAVEPDTEANFGDITDAAEGDVATIEIELTDVADMASNDTILWVNESDYNANVSFEFDDDDFVEDTTLEVEWNTFEAGASAAAGGSTADADIFNVTNYDNVTTHIHEETNISHADDFRLNPAGYTLAAFSDGTADERDDSASLTIHDRATGDMTTYVVANETDTSELDWIVDNATESEDVAELDYLVVAQEITGVFGQINDSADSLSDAGLEITFEPVDVPAYQSPNTFNLTDGDRSDNLTHIPDADAGVIYFLLEHNTTDLEPDDTEDWDIEFDVTEDNAYIDDEDDEESASGSYTLVERLLDIAVVEAPYQVTPDENAVIEGTSTLAPGTNISMEVDKPGHFIVTDDTIEVADDEDRTWTFEHDFSDREIGEEFDIDVEEATLGVASDSAEGVFNATPEADTDDEVTQLEQEISDLEDEIADLEDEIADLEGQLADAEGDVSDLEQQLADAESDLADAEADRDGALEDLSDAEDTISQLEGDLSDANDEIEQLESDLADAEADDDDEQPAFGPIAALFALLAGGALIARRRL